MTFRETSLFMERIKSHYQEFVIDEFKIKEWHKELANYDSEDVNKKFEEHLKSEIYGDQIPKLYFLTKYLVPSKDKGKIIRHTVICQLCGQTMFDSSYDEHYKRCSASMTMVKDLEKYLSLVVNYQNLMSVNAQKFEELYVAYLNKMADANIPDFRKKLILRCLYPNVDIDINELLKGLSSKI